MVYYCYRITGDYNILMNSLFKIKTAFTLMELMIALVIIGVVSVVTVKILSSRNDYVYKYMYNATLKDLKMGVGTLIAEGTADSKGNLYKYLPANGHTSNEDGFCDRLSSILNTVGPSDCTRTITDEAGPFDTTTANFIATNGMRFFNFGSDPTNNIYTIYVDIDGAKGNSQFNSDVYRFWIDRCGQLLTTYSTTCTVNIPNGGGGTDPTATCGQNGVTYSQPGGVGTTIFVNDATSSVNCSSLNYECGVNGYYYGQDSDTKAVYRYDKTAYDAKSSVLRCLQWNCGESAYVGGINYIFNNPHYAPPSGSDHNVYVYDGIAHDDGTDLACDSWLCGSGGVVKTYDSGYTTRTDYDTKAKSAGHDIVCNTYTCTTGTFIGGGGVGYEARQTRCGTDPAPVNCLYVASLSVSGYYCTTYGSGQPDNYTYSGCALTGTSSGIAGTSCASSCTAGTNWAPITYNGTSNYLLQQLTCNNVGGGTQLCKQIYYNGELAHSCNFSADSAYVHSLSGGYTPPGFGSGSPPPYINPTPVSSCTPGVKVDGPYGIGDLGSNPNYGCFYEVTSCTYGNATCSN